MIPKRLPVLSRVDYVPDFGAIIRQSREECGMHQKHLAELLGVEPTTISNWEAGKRRISAENLYKIAVICNTTIKLEG